MTDVINGSQIDWTILPPTVVKQGSLFTVVARFEDRVRLQVYEAYIPDQFGGISERFLGNAIHTSPGFNNDSKPATYAWFNIWTMQRGKVEFKFRLTWKRGHHMYGAVETFEIMVRNHTEPIEYRTDDQDLLALLDPDHYDPTPIEEMNERA
ncbi:hypothetical protein F4782DRAFT_526589 [Xylaria castorea]|nr:hypothetical protein F4782DRAFT_526589 [Xylaria castorea]